MDCASCGKSIEDGSRFCRFCGATQPSSETSAKPKPNNKPLIIICAVILGLFAISSLGSGEGSQAGNSAEAQADAIETQADRLEAIADGASKSPLSGSPWTYSSSIDKVRGAASYQATTLSTNKVYQDSPYGGGTTMEMTVRKHPEWGTDVILTISEGQMMCPSYSGCSGMVSFDGGKPQRVNFTGPSDNSSEVVFIDGAQSFIAKLKRAKRVVVEKTLYQAGAPQFEFNVEGLKDWNDAFDKGGNAITAPGPTSTVKCDPKLAASNGLTCDGV